MGQAKIRKQMLQTVFSETIPDGGLFFLCRRNGVSVVLAVRRTDGGQVQVGLFCMDDWQEGFFQCLGRAYDSGAQFQEDFQANGNKFKLSRDEDCRRRVALGLRVRQEAGEEIPEEWARWGFLLGSSGEVRLPQSLYLCPLCDSPLPDEICEKILDCIGGDTTCYMVCRDCIEHDRSRVSAETACIEHDRTMRMFEDMESFSLGFEENKSDFQMAMPGQAHRDAIPLFLEQNGDPALAAAFALETWMNRAAGPNENVSDGHVKQALEEILESRKSHTPLPENGCKEVKFVRDAAQEGLAAYAAACRNRWDASAMENYVTAGIEKVLESVKNHHSIFNGRSYIKFISKYFK